jgi:hypothetical protein
MSFFDYVAGNSPVQPLSVSLAEPHHIREVEQAPEECFQFAKTCPLKKNHRL